MKRILFFCSLIFILSACTTTSTGKGFSAFDDNKVLEAIPHFEQGLIEGDKLAPMMLSMIYLADTHVPRNIDQSKIYYDKVFEMEGNTFDQYLDYYLPYIQAKISLLDDDIDNDLQGVKLLRQGKYKNYAPVLALLARCYSYEIGVDKNYKLANQLFMRSVQFDLKDWSRLKYAWVLATHEDDSFDYGINAMAYIPDINEVDIDEEYLFIYYDTLAVAHAKNGQFDDAIASEKKAIKLIKKQLSIYPNYENWIADFQDRLALFEDGRPYTSSEL